MSALDSGEVWVYNDYVETGRGGFVSSPETRKPNIVGIAPAITGRNPALFVSATISKVIAGVRV